MDGWTTSKQYTPNTVCGGDNFNNNNNNKVGKPAPLDPFLSGNP